MEIYLLVTKGKVGTALRTLSDVQLDIIREAQSSEEAIQPQ